MKFKNKEKNYFIVLSYFVTVLVNSIRVTNWNTLLTGTSNTIDNFGKKRRQKNEFPENSGYYR